MLYSLTIECYAILGKRWTILQQLLCNSKFHLQIEFDLKVEISKDIWIKGDQALFSKMISLITEGYCSMTLVVLHDKCPKSDLFTLLLRSVDCDMTCTPSIPKYLSF